MEEAIWRGSPRTKAGRPPKRPEERRVHLTVRLAPTSVPVLDQLAERLGLSRAAVLEQGLAALVEQHPESKPVKGES